MILFKWYELQIIYQNIGKYVGFPERSETRNKVFAYTSRIVIKISLIGQNTQSEKNYWSKSYSKFFFLTNEWNKKKNSNDNKSFYESLYKNNFLITKGELSNYPILKMIIKKYIFTEEKKKKKR